jgi:hypothetical protein
MFGTMTTQQIANDAHAVVMKHYLQKGTGLLYMYTEPYSAGGIKLPTKKQIRQCIPNSNGFSTPLENGCLTTAQYLDSMVHRYLVTRLPVHAAEARRLYRGLMILAASSKFPGFVPRGVLPDGKTHYPDSSIDQQSFWLMGLVSFYRHLATVAERREIRRVICGFVGACENAGWKCLREDGLVGYWCDLNGQAKVPRSDLILLMFCKVAYFVSEDEHWQRQYRTFAGSFFAQGGTSARHLLEETWISSQTSWLVDTLYALEEDKRYGAFYAKLSLAFAKKAASRMPAYSRYEPTRGFSDFSFMSDTCRNVLYGLISLATCTDADFVKANLALADRVIRHYDFHADGKLVDHMDPIVRFYWRLAARGLLPWDPQHEKPGNPALRAISRNNAYERHGEAHWYDAATASFIGADCPGEKNSRYYYVPGNPDIVPERITNV